MDEKKLTKKKFVEERFKLYKEKNWTEYEEFLQWEI